MSLATILGSAGLAGASGHRAFIPALALGCLHHLGAATVQTGSEPFFQQNGLLFLGVDELSALADQLAVAQPFLGALVDDPTLRGFFGVVELALSQDDPTAAEASLPAGTATSSSRTEPCPLAGSNIPARWASRRSNGSSRSWKCGTRSDGRGVSSKRT